MPRPTLSVALVALLTPGLLVAGLGAPSAAATSPVVLETGSTPDTRPFPDDVFTVADTAQATGRRVALPTAGCAPAECADLALLNRMDGFDVRPRVTLPFSAEVDLRTITPETVRVLGPSGLRTGLVQLVQDPITGTVSGYPDAYLLPGTRYTLVVTAGILAADGTPVAVGATPYSATFTTMTTTDVLDDVRTALDAGTAYTMAGIAAGARTVRFDTADDGQPSIFPASITTTGITAQQQTGTSTFTPYGVPNTAKTYATYGFGSFQSPQYLRADVTIASTPTRSAPAPVGAARLGVAMIAPAPSATCIKPVVFGHGFTRSKLDLFLASDTLGQSNLAVFATDVPGHGFGPDSTYAVRTAAGTRTGDLLTRGRDLNADGVIASTEGVAAGGVNGSVNSRDALIQAVVDNMALVRALEQGVDVDGNGTVDTCTGNGAVTYFGQSGGGIYGTVLLGTDPKVVAGVPNVPGGPTTEISRLGGFRPLLAANLAAGGLLNGGPGLNGFTESMPLRRDPKVSDPVQGAVPIQETLARASWIQRSGDPTAYAPRLRPEAVFGAKRVLVQVAYGDGTVPNPTTAELLRAGDLYDDTWVYRNDRTANAANDPHGFLLNPFLPAHFEGQEQIRRFLGEGEERDPDAAKADWEPALSQAGSAATADYRVQLDCLHYPDPQTGQQQVRTAPADACTDRSATVAPKAAPTLDQFVPLATAARVLDTRTGPAPARRTGRSTVDLAALVRDAGATSAVLNVTVLNASTPGHVVVFPSGAPLPPTSNVNVLPGATQANEVVVRLNQERKVDLAVQHTTADVVVDVVGFLTPSSAPGGLKATPAQRLLDTRTTATPLRTGPVVVDLAGTAAQGAQAVVLNVTATQTSGAGHVTVYPSGTAKPGTSNVNYAAGQTRANSVIVQVGRDGTVTLDVRTAAALVVDLVGAVNATGGDFRALDAPRRLLDTRIGTGAPAGAVSTKVDITLPADRPAGVVGVVLNVTAVGANRAGHVTVHAGGTPLPRTSNVNFVARVAQANEVLTQVSAAGTVSLHVGGGATTQLVADVVGYVTE